MKAIMEVRMVTRSGVDMDGIRVSVEYGKNMVRDAMRKATRLFAQAKDRPEKVDKLSAQEMERQHRRAVKINKAFPAQVILMMT